MLKQYEDVRYIYMVNVVLHATSYYTTCVSTIAIVVNIRYFNYTLITMNISILLTILISIILTIMINLFLVIIISKLIVTIIEKKWKEKDV